MLQVSKILKIVYKKIFYINIMKLTEGQKKKLEKHADHHTKKHMELMKRLMRQGLSFNEAHSIAKARVGK